MKINIDKEKIGQKLNGLTKNAGKESTKSIDKERISNFSKRAIEKTGDTSKKAIGLVKTAIKNYNDQKQSVDYEARMKKYNPIFPEQYSSPDFNIPNLVIIVDDAVRKDIDICKDAIGWLSNQKGVEVLHLYDEAIPYSGLQFIPTAVCDCAYYVDPHDRNRFISTDIFFSNTQEEKLAELQHIAFSLGAKSYQVEMIEFNEDSNEKSVDAAAFIHKHGLSSVTVIDRAKSSNSQALATATFSGNKTPELPTLCWFKHDKNVQNLIAMRCSKASTNDINEYSIELSNSNAASMSLSTANKVDGAINKMGLSCNFDIKSKEEHHRKMIFKVSF